MMWGPGVLHLSGGLGSQQVWALNSATDEACWIFRCDRDGVIDNLSFWVTAKAGAARTWDVSIEGINATGYPDSADYGGSSPGTLDSSLAAAGSGIQVAMGTGATVSQGDQIAVRLVPTGTAPDASNNITLRVGSPNYSGNATAPYPLTGTSINNGTSWTFNDDHPCVGIQYSDGSWVFADYDIPGSLSSVTQFDSADSPNEYGACFTLPYAMEVFGVRLAHRGGTLIHPTITLYDSDGSTPLGSAQTWHRTAQNRTTDALWVPVDLNASTTYYIGVTNPSAVTTIGEPWYAILDDATKRAGYPFADGERWSHATRTGAGAWTTMNLHLPMMALYVSGVG
jgi:hypothetical protein